MVILGRGRKGSQRVNEEALLDTWQEAGREINERGRLADTSYERSPLVSIRRFGWGGLDEQHAGFVHGPDRGTALPLFEKAMRRKLRGSSLSVNRDEY